MGHLNRDESDISPKRQHTVPGAFAYLSAAIVYIPVLSSSVILKVVVSFSLVRSTSLKLSITPLTLTVS